MADLPRNLKLLAIAFARLGGEADLARLYAEIRALDPKWPARYRSDETFEATVRKTIEDHCPQSENFSPERPALFQRTERGRYRVLRPDEREVIEARGRRLE